MSGWPVTSTLLAYVYSRPVSFSQVTDLAVASSLPVTALAYFSATWTILAVSGLPPPPPPPPPPGVVGGVVGVTWIGGALSLVSVGAAPLTSDVGEVGLAGE